jgi:hypothetical protein
MPYVRTCADANFDATTQTCSVEEWVQQPAGWLPLPSLTMQEGAQIGFAMMAGWIVPWAWRQVGQMLNDSSKTDD